MALSRPAARRLIVIALAAALSGAPLRAVPQGSSARFTTFEELEKAVGMAREAVRTRPQDAAAWTELGRLLTTDGKFPEAEEALRKALAADPRCIPALTLLSQLYRAEYRFAAGRAELAKAATLAPEREDVRVLEASFDLDRMDFAAAAATFRAILGRQPGSAAALCGLAEVAYWENRYDDALALVGRCIAADPAFGRAFLFKSLIHRIRQENDEWKAAGRKAVEVSPFDDEARANLFNILARGEQKMKEGYAEAKVALRLNPYCYSAHNYIGNGWTPVAYGEDRPGGPPEAAARIRALDQEGGAALISRDLDRADKLFDEVLRLSANNLRALIGRGTSAYHRGRFEEARGWFVRALAADPDYGLAHYGLAQSLLRLKDAVNVRLAGIEKSFAARGVPEPAALRDVFINYTSLDSDLQKIIRLSVRPLRAFLPSAKEKGATFYITPFHMLQSEAPGMAGIRGQRTFDGRLWDDVKGLGGTHALSGEDWERDVKRLRYNVVAHEFTHQVHGLMPADLRDEVKTLFEKAKKERRTLDFYADFNEFEYFATGVEAYVSDEKLADQKIAYGHTRAELLARDPDLYRFIERLDAKDRL